MGGFFGGRKKDKEDADVGQTARRSRRVVVPGQGGQPVQRPPSNAPAAPPAPMQKGPASAPARPAAPTPPRPGTVRVSKPSADGTASRIASPPAAPPSQVKRSPPSSPLPAQQSAARPKTKEPILASRPPEFAGDLANAARNGPCRSGDSALLDFLINKAHLLDAEQAEAIKGQAQEENDPIDIVAVKQGLITEEQLVNALTQECWVPHLKVDKYEIRKKALDTIAREDAMHYGVFPVDKLGSLLTLAMVNPLDAETIRVLESKTGLDIKKVVATRSEITQGIEKYYSGLVVAKDTSLAFTQDVEPKSVTQMLQRVNTAPAPAPAPARAAAPVHAHAPERIVPEIQDIDELLAGDEIISPAIIDPVHIEPIIEEPVMLSPEELEPAAVKPVLSEIADELEGVAIAAPASSRLVKTAPAPVATDAGLLDLDIDITIPDAAPPKPAIKPATRPISKPLAVPSSEQFSPSTQQAAKAPSALERSGGFKTPPAAPVRPPGGSSAPARPAVTAMPPAAKPTTSRLARPGTGRHVQTGHPSVTNLIPVMEEEFQHAITHGKAHVFEKWVGLQTRNRIINGVPIEDEVVEAFSRLFAAPRRI